MRLTLPSGPAHLTYCTNVHRGEGWAETFGALRRHLPAVKRNASPGAAMGVGLRLSAVAAETLREPAEFDALRGFLEDEDLYVFTLNGFPYGPFHGERVKERVYAPDWREPERLAYTDQLAELLAALLPVEPGLSGSVSTVPGAFHAAGSSPGAREAIAEALLRHAARLAALEDRTGRRIALALEPEPMCLLETTAEAVEFFERHLFSSAAAVRFAALSGRSPAEAETLLRRHLGLCLDVCHAAVEFETPGDSLALLRRAGIAVAKLQLSSALAVPRMDAAAADLLRRFDDGVYLHQVVERGSGGGLVRFLDLPDALAARAEGAEGGLEWRVHCHVPVFHDAPLGRFATTQPMLLDMLERQREDGVSAHLEVETYTWDVLPPELRADGLDAAISRELLWVRDRLAA
ncbi:MAG: TIM barrel protein possibly involved in myo-inositol catabolism [uncultured Acetobacteraceae bacterium]|uniref:TIM barrel protein possibly involved in myo-inositol catabolism n=1 Tax=uncultured Acetobacteraceae bacterium TaxID=169975 RepID=A0A6J4I417_9PROT|nr:MAG: TIM barrel protein possibly involved in myo-inositol catabolism [uncultured Acetobacteraceae bacterium]